MEIYNKNGFYPHTDLEMIAPEDEMQKVLSESQKLRLVALVSCR